VRHGGNTSCVEVELADGTLLVLDAGTGVRPLGLRLAEREGPIHVLLTHLHLDHLEGLAFFLPIWSAGRDVHIWGPRSPLESLEDRIARYFSPPLFPIEVRAVPAALTFHDVPKTAWTIGDALLTADFVLHPGPTVGYRIELAGASVAYLPDHEPALAGPVEATPADWISGTALAHDADVVVHDAQYFEEEYERHVGWGHSSVADAVAFACAAEARRLLLFHHEPRHSDRALERLEDRARELADGASAPALAREGMVLEL
jgi:phosphoribosyl 1,2-cyclic phosphodiesterase